MVIKTIRLTIMTILLLLPLKALGEQTYFTTAKETIEEAKKLYSQSQQLPVVVIVRGVHERGYRVYTDSSYLGKESLVIEIPTYIGRGDDIYCAALDHLRGLTGRGNRILNTLREIQKEFGNIDGSIFHSGAVVALKNAAGSNRFNEVFQKGKMGKVAFAGAYAGPKLSKAMDNTGIQWNSFAFENDLVVNITKTNLQGIGLSGEFHLTPLQLLMAPMRVPASALGGVLKIPHMLLFPTELKDHPLQSYKGDIVSWLADPDKYEKDKVSQKKKKSKKKDKEDKSYTSSDNGGNNNDGGGPDGDSDGNGTDSQDGGNRESDNFSELMKNEKLSLEITTQEDGTVFLKMQKNTSEPLNFMIPNATPLKTGSGSQSMGM